MMHVTRRQLLGTALLSAAASTAMLSGLSRSAAAEGGIESLNWAISGFPDVLFVPHQWSVNAGGIMSLVQEGLVAFDDDLAITEAVASSWEQTDPLTYVYTLRDGVTFHDGSPVTVEDVIFSMAWHRIPDNGSQMTPFYGSVDTITATGDREITVKLAKPDAQFQYTPGHMSGFIMKKAQVEAHPDDFGTPDVLPLGTGPYKLVEFVPGERIVMEAYEGYWGEMPAARTLTMRMIPDEQTRLLAMQNGDLDGTFDVPISEIDQWRALPGTEIVTTPSLGVYMLTLDLETPPLDNIHVRRAIAHSIDKEGLTQALLGGSGSSAVSVNPPEMWAGVLPVDEVKAFYGELNAYPFDLAKAKEEWDKAGVDGFAMRVPVSSSDPYMASIVLTLAENLRPLGIELTVEELDHTQWLAQYLDHENLGLQMRRYFPDYADPANYPFLFFASQNARENGPNTSNMKDEEMDALIAQALEVSEPAKRAELLKEITIKENEELPAIPIFWPDSAIAVKEDYAFTGFTAFWYNQPWANRGFGLK